MIRTHDQRPAGEPAPSGPGSLELVLRQVAGIDAWVSRFREDVAPPETAALSREMRLDLIRRLDARRREQEALLRRAEAQLVASGELLAGRAPLRAVLAHRQSWLCDKVSARLRHWGVEVIGCYDDGADAVGTLVVEQPDLLLVEDRLPTLSGVEVAQRARDFSPGTVVGAQVADGSGVSVLADAGARAVFTRRIPPADIADQLVSCLTRTDAELVALT